jgi:maleate isomerase
VELASQDVDVITMGGTPPVVVGGYGFDKTIIELINITTRIPATTSQTSVNKAMKLLGAKKIIVVTPFKDDINLAIKKFLEDSEFEIGSIKTANASFESYPEIPPSVPYNLALEGVKETPDAECIFIPCPAWPVTENIEALEEETGLPVVASAQAEVWGALRLMGVKTPVEGYGRILRDY